MPTDDELLGRLLTALALAKSAPDEAQLDVAIDDAAGLLAANLAAFNRIFVQDQDR